MASIHLPAPATNVPPSPQRSGSRYGPIPIGTPAIVGRAYPGREITAGTGNRIDANSRPRSNRTVTPGAPSSGISRNAGSAAMVSSNAGFPINNASRDRGSNSTSPVVDRYHSRTTPIRKSNAPWSMLPGPAAQANGEPRVTDGVSLATRINRKISFGDSATTYARPSRQTISVVSPSCRDLLPIARHVTPTLRTLEARPIGTGNRSGPENALHARPCPGDLSYRLISPIASAAQPRAQHRNANATPGATPAADKTNANNNANATPR